MLHTTFIERLFLSLTHHFSMIFMLLICLCATFSTYATKVVKVCHATMRLNAYTIGSICAETNTNSHLFQNDLVRGIKLDAVAMVKTGFSSISRVLSAQKLGSQHLILRLVKLNFDRTKTAISTLSSWP